MRRNSVPFPCAHCGATFLRATWQAKRGQVYCSHACGCKARTARRGDTNALSSAAVLRFLRYEPGTGDFTWIVDRPSAMKRVGDLAGHIDNEGYLRIGILGRNIAAHRLAWFLVTGTLPRSQIDHINGNRADNRFANLRDVEPRLNSENKRNVVGASFEKESGKWRAQITVRGQGRTLGRFATVDEARAAYIAAKRRLHDGCTI